MSGNNTANQKHPREKVPFMLGASAISLVMTFTAAGLASHDRDIVEAYKANPEDKKAEIRAKNYRPFMTDCILNDSHAQIDRQLDGGEKVLRTTSDIHGEYGQSCITQTVSYKHLTLPTN